MTPLGGLATVVAAVSVLAGCGGTGGATLRLGHDQPDGHPYDLAMDRFAEGVESATGGAVRITVYPAAQLGDSPEQFEGLRLGTLDLALSAFSHASQFCRELGLFGAPYLFESDEHFARVFDDEVGRLLDEACRERYGVRLLSTLTSGDRVLVNGRRPIGQAADLAGLKIRVMSGEADALTWQAFGAIPVPMPYSEIYSALQAGVIDGAENEPVSIMSNRFYEAARFVALTRHLVLPMGLFMSERALARLPEPSRAILAAQAREAAAWERSLMARENAGALAEMADRYGVSVSSPDVAALRAMSRDVQDRVAASLSLELLLSKVREAAR